MALASGKGILINSRPSWTTRAVSARIGIAHMKAVASTETHGGEDFDLAAEPAISPERRKEWWWQFLLVWAFVVSLWTGLDCALDPGVNIGDPIGLVQIALPTALLVAPGAAVYACARLVPRPTGLQDMQESGQKRQCAAVFLGDSLTQGTVSANFLEVIARQHSGLGEFVNVGMNMRPLGDALAGSLLEEIKALKPVHGVVVLLGTNDIIRYTALPAPLRQPIRGWLEAYASTLSDVVSRLQPASVLLASPPPLGEDLASEEGRLGAEIAATVQQVASDLGCRYVPLYETVADHLDLARNTGALASGSRPYSLPESLALLCALPWRLYSGSGTSLRELQAEQGLEFTVDLVHYGPRFAAVAARLFAEHLSLRT